MTSFFDIFLVITLVPSLRAASSSDVRDICYPSVGCFTNLSPWASPSRPALPPQDPMKVSSSMSFYSSDALDGIVFPTCPDINLSEVPYDNNRTIIMIFYGYSSNATDPWILALKDALLRRRDANIIVAGYGVVPRGSDEQAAGDARVIARVAAQVVGAIGVDPSEVHLIGHSLGAHIAAYTANAVEETGAKIGRITGLEPTSQLFEGQPNEVRLDASDADFVEVLHTNAGGSGIITPSGHVDFYFNGGSAQPACQQQSSSNECNHEIVHDYYIEAVDESCFFGQPAELKMNSDGTLGSLEQVKGKTTLAPVGLEVSPTNGIFLVITNPVSPYCNSSERSVKIAPY